MSPPFPGGRGVVGHAHVQSIGGSSVKPRGLALRFAERACDRALDEPSTSSFLTPMQRLM